MKKRARFAILNFVKSSRTVPFPMNVLINGEAREFDRPLSVAELLKRLELDPRKIAVERNLEIVPRSQYGDTMLGNGDRLEIVHFIGGG